MLICMVPAISLVSYADVATAPAVGTYEYYEHLWYDDGHLLSFVDMTHMTQDEIVINSESLELENTDYRIINGKTGFTTNSGLRSYAKIIDGKNEGKYYLITISGTYNGDGTGGIMDNYSFAPDSEGFLKIPTAAARGNTAAERSGIWLGHAYTSDEVTTPMERGHQSVNLLDAEIDYGSPDALNTFTVDMVMDYNIPTINPGGVLLLSIATSSERFANSSSEEPFGNTTNALDTAKSRTDAYYVLGGYQPTGAGVNMYWLGYNGRYQGNLNCSYYGGAFPSGSALHVAYNIKYTAPTAFMLKHTALMMSGAWASSEANAPKVTEPSNGYPSYGAYLDMTALMANVPDAANMYYLRVYDCALAEEQLKQNHFADLCYYYGVDLTAYNNLTKKFKAQVIEGAQSINLGDTAYAKSDLEALIANVMRDAMPEVGDAAADYRTKVVDDELAKYIDLYYDDGHLMSMLYLSDVESSDVVYNGDGVEIDGARVVLGNKHEANGVYDSYVRILAGKYAGEYYKLANQAQDNSYTLKVEIDGEGFIKYNEPFFAFGTRDIGVRFSYTYAEEDINKPDPRISQKSRFIYNTDYLQYDNTYGNFTMEGVYRMHAPYYSVGNEKQDVFSLLMALGNHQGCFVVKTGKNNQAITSFYSGTTHGDGTQREVIYEIGETHHYMARASFSTPTKMMRSIYFYHHREGMVTTNAGKENGYDLATMLNNDRSKFAAHNQGSQMYFLRFYDVSLTPAQMKQNHFADLCYYYGLENVEALVKIGSSALTEEFYDGYKQYRVGMCSPVEINAMQTGINNAINSVINADRVIDTIAQYYNTAVANATSSAASLAVVTDIMNSIDASIEQVKNIESLDAEGAVIIANCVQELESIKENINLYYLIVQSYNANVSEVKDIATQLKNASVSGTAIDVLLENRNKLEGKMHYSNEGAANNAKFAVLASEGQVKIGSIMSVANSVNAQTAFNVEDYIKFAGYQVRITDFAAMRALFAVDTEAVANGYSYGNLSYDIVSLGFILADATSASMDATYDGERVSTDAKNPLVRYVDKWSREETLDSAVNEITGFEDAEAYSIIKAFDDADSSNIADEYQKEYKLRAFIVLEGEGTQFIRYLDVESVNVGDTVSMYELAKHASTVESAENLKDEYYISRVIAAVEGKED